jgi:Flp pilus assembly protein TadD
MASVHASAVLYLLVLSFGPILLSGQIKNSERSRAAAVDKYAPVVISADRLRSQLSGSARHMIEKAHTDSQNGDHKRAIEDLKYVLVKDRSAAPYVYSILGFEYLQLGRTADATLALRQAVLLFPGEALNHSNLAAALYAEGHYSQAESEVLRALKLDPVNETSKLILRLVLSKRRRDGS